MNILAYDLETTGLATQYDRPHQFAACLYDDDTNLLRQFDLRGRLPRYLLPGPDALLKADKTFAQIQEAPLSHYEFMKAVADVIRANSPAITVTFNGIRYDEAVLRHSFYANLMEPYLTQYNGNTRLDVLKAARAVAACAPDALNLPRNDQGKRVFTLEEVAQANGFVGHVAHDALSDVHATMHLAQVIAERAPAVWERVSRLRGKPFVSGLLGARKPLVEVRWNHEEDRPNFRAIVPVAQDEEDSNVWLCIGLDTDIARLKSMDATALEGEFWANEGYPSIVRMRANAMPLVLTLDDARALNVPATFNPFKVIAVESDPNFAARLAAASRQRKSRFAEPTEVWEQLYSSGFFPVREDKPVIARFHRSSIRERWEMIPDLIDPRARKLARWLVGSEWPEVLDPAERRLIEEEFREHLMRPEAKWTTVPSALGRIKELSTSIAGEQAAILEGYRAHLLSLHEMNAFSVHAN